jgi:hypothetical protein
MMRSRLTIRSAVEALTNDLDELHSMVSVNLQLKAPISIICCLMLMITIIDHDGSISTLLLNRAVAYLMLENYYKAALSSFASIIISNKRTPKAMYRLARALQCINIIMDSLFVSQQSLKHFP